MSDRLTTEDLYGKTPNSDPENGSSKPLEYEETPIIDPVTATTQDQLSAVALPDTKKEEVPRLPEPHQLPRTANHQTPPQNHRTHPFVTLFAFLLLFAAGIWLSSSLRQLLPSDIQESIGLSDRKVTLSPTPRVSITPTGSITTQPQWKPYSVISGVSKKPFDGVLFSLPQSVLPPICDGSACASQGTYLPGGTRFTVAARGLGQSLRDYRGSAISDANGVTFTTKNITVGGISSMEFTGTFTGKTISGYAFTTMRGVMIPISETTSIELNHFIPNGVTADFKADDVLFDAILNTLSVKSTQAQKGVVLVSPTSIASSSAR